MYKTALIAGGTGFVGRKLTFVLKEHGFRVYKLSRKKTIRSGYIHWDPELQTIDSKNLPKINVIVNLLGSNIAEKRWTNSRKKELISSRVNTTNYLRILASQMPNLEYYISASGINCYGPESEKVHVESDSFGDDFLSKLVKEWEEASDKFSDICPVAKIRSGVVLAKHGGMLKKVIFPFKLGLGSALGSGKQHMPWIHLDDLCRLFSMAIQYKWEGSYNAFTACSTNLEFSRALASAIRRPFFMPNIPEKLLYFLLGERAIMLVGGTKVSNQKILQAGFNFQHKTIDSTLKHIIRK
jgi:uncharacterized protein (TIGR01777 family)